MHLPRLTHPVLDASLLLLVRQQWTDHAMAGLSYQTGLLSQKPVHGDDECVCLSHSVSDWKH